VLEEQPLLDEIRQELLVGNGQRYEREPAQPRALPQVMRPISGAGGMAMRKELRRESNCFFSLTSGNCG
jgi:hypothetical protein